MVHENNLNWLLYRSMAIKISTHNVHTSIVVTLCINIYFTVIRCKIYALLPDQHNNTLKSRVKAESKEIKWITLGNRTSSNHLKIRICYFSTILGHLQSFRDCLIKKGMYFRSVFSLLERFHTRWFSCQFLKFRYQQTTPIPFLLTSVFGTVEEEKNCLHNIHYKYEYIIFEMC